MQEIKPSSILGDVPYRGAGIYRIVNKVNGKSYVGSSAWVRKRCRSHARKLIKGEHDNIIMQQAFDKYGADAFEVVVLELVDDLGLLVEREQHWIDLLDTVASGYNIRPFAESNRGHKMSEEVRRKMSESRKGRARPPEATEKARQQLLGRPHSEERKRNISAAKKGKKLSPEHVEKMRQSLIGRKGTERQRHSTIERNKSRVWTEESRQRMSEQKKGKPAPKHVIDNLIAYHTGRPKPAEVVAKIAASNRGKKRTPEQCERIRAGILAAKAKRAAEAQEAALNG